MKKKILLTSLCVCTLLSLAACGDGDKGVKHNFVLHEATAPTCETAGNEAYYTCDDCDKIFDVNKAEITEIPTLEAAGHDYVLQNATDGKCNEKAIVQHYTCDDCDKLFDLTKQEISSAEGDFNPSVHASALVLVAQNNPTKTAYKVGETFDPTGMVVVSKCGDCDGEIVDNANLTYTYQTAGANAFALTDTKITVNYNGTSFDVNVTVSKANVEITGVEESYETVCGVAPKINPVASITDSVINVKYYDGETEVAATDFTAGKTYTAKVTVAETETALGAEKTAQITVKHGHAWKEDTSDWKKLTYECVCGDKKDFYAMNYQTPYVDADNLAIDLSKFVFGAQSVSVKSLKQIVRMQSTGYVAAKDGEVVDIQPIAQEGMKYSFAADKYEKPTADRTPYILTLSVVYDIDGAECTLIVEAKLVDKLIDDANDLLALAYTADPTSATNPNYGYYVLIKDVNASGVQITGSNPCWNASSGFRGTFVGNGFTISNLNVTGGQGLFGAIGDGANISDVKFTNVTVAAGTYALSYCARNAKFNNVTVEFSVNSASYWVTRVGDSTFTGVSVLTDKAAGNAFIVDTDESAAMPNGITATYFQESKVTFDSNGGSEVPFAMVVTGRKITKPTNPIKASDEEFDYQFAGWFNGNQEWKFDTPVTTDITLTAQWNKTERLNETELIAAANAAISALPASVTLPKDIHRVPTIMAAKQAFDALSADGQAQVVGADKLAALVAAIQGYYTVYVPDADGVAAIPGSAAVKKTDIPVTGALSTDATVGAIFTGTSGTGGNVSILFKNFPDVSAYDKLYFYVRSSVSGCLYVADGDGSGDGWGTTYKNNYNDIAADNTSTNKAWVEANQWNLVEFDTSLGCFTTSWFASMWSNATDFTLEVASIIGVKSSEVVPSTPTAPANDVLYDASMQTISSWDIGNAITAVAGTDATYGDIWTFTANGTWEQSVQNSVAIDPTGYEKIYFYVYNSYENARLQIHGGWTTGWEKVKIENLETGWTKVEVDVSVITTDEAGKLYIVLQERDGKNFENCEFKISSFYGLKAGETAPEL